MLLSTKALVYLCDFLCFSPFSVYLIVVYFQIIAFDELKTDYKNPIDQCNSLNPVSNEGLIEFILTLLLSSSSSKYKKKT